VRLKCIVIICISDYFGLISENYVTFNGRFLEVYSWICIQCRLSRRRGRDDIYLLYTCSVDNFQDPYRKDQVVGPRIAVLL